MGRIIGRDKEKDELLSALKSPAPEFIALYGRRRVGKTYLVKNTFQDMNGVLFFSMTGTKDGLLSEQLENFTKRVGETFFTGARLEIPSTWKQAFSTLTDYIRVSKQKKIVLFFDEFPWLVTKNSRLLQTLQFYWNEYWGNDPRIKLIICGSSASWILKNVVNNRGGLYNRVTRTMHLEPFTLDQAKKFLAYQKVNLPNKQLIELYMVLGGIPHYLAKVKPGLSLAQIVDTLAFGKNSFLMQEFSNLYATLFDTGDGHIELARIIAQHHYGIGQEELARQAPTISSGGSFVRWLKDLEEAGFIQRFKPYLSSKKGIYFKMIDEYSLFYFTWIEPINSSLLARGMRKGYWEGKIHTPEWNSWTGYAFESACYKHIPQISTALTLSPTAVPYSWRYVPIRKTKDSGAQIDLLFDRQDDAITLCEIKYTDKPFVIDKAYAGALTQRIDIFTTKTKTQKALFFAFVSASGLKKTLYSEAIVNGGVVTADDLCKKVD